MIPIRQGLAAGRENVDALPSRAAFAFPRPLVGDLAEELTLVVVAPPLVPIVSGHGNERFSSKSDECRVGEGERPARHTIVSGTAERIPVHFPEKDRLALRRRLLARLPKIRQPRNLIPFVFGCTGLDQCVK